MNKTLAAILAVMIMFGVLYILMPEGIPGMGGGNGALDPSEESNGMIGKLYDDVSELAWYPQNLLLVILVAGVGFAGIAYYWKRIED